MTSFKSSVTSGRSLTRSSAKLENPAIMVSRLLKSCETPDAKRPMASIFSEWRSLSSRFLFDNNAVSRSM